MLEPFAFAKSVYKAVDSMDPSQVRPYLTSGCCFRLGNMPEVCGRDAFEAASQRFYDMLSSITHRIHASWATDDDYLISKLTVTYCRRDGYVLTCPAAAIWRLTGDRISEYDVYVDNSRLFA